MLFRQTWATPDESGYNRHTSPFEVYYDTRESHVPLIRCLSYRTLNDAAIYMPIAGFSSRRPRLCTAESAKPICVLHYDTILT